MLFNFYNLQVGGLRSQQGRLSAQSPLLIVPLDITHCYYISPHLDTHWWSRVRRENRLRDSHDDFSWIIRGKLSQFYVYTRPRVLYTCSRCMYYNNISVVVDVFERFPTAYNRLVHREGKVQDECRVPTGVVLCSVPRLQQLAGVYDNLRSNISVTRFSCLVSLVRTTDKL